MLMEISYAQSGPIFPFPAESKSDKECVYRTMNTNNYFMIKLAMASDIDPPQFSRFISCVDWHVQLFNLSKEDNNGNGISLRMIKKAEILVLKWQILHGSSLFKRDNLRALDNFVPSSKYLK